MKTTLRRLQENDEVAFFEGLKAWDGEELLWYTFAWKPGMPYSEMLAILEREFQGIALAPDRVPHSMLYAFVDEKIIGRVSVRHQLNDFLKKRGGHIGYSVAPKYRGNGYATEMLGAALAYCQRELRLTSLLLTCAETNFASIKVIEKNGGILEARLYDDADKKDIRHYRINLPPREQN